jgi:hypothetical protein
MTPKQQKRVASAPESFRKLLTACFAGKSSPRACIKAQCAECCGFDRQAVADCTADACPLWGMRPYVKHPKTHEGSEKSTQNRSEEEKGTE